MVVAVAIKKTLEPGQVEPKNTRLTIPQARVTLKAALQNELGRVPTTAELKMLLAQSALETWDWKSMWNWNFGNIQVGSSGAQWFYLKHKDSSENLNRYRTFGSAAEGAAYYVKKLHNQFTQAWNLLGSGDTTAFANALKAERYYTGDPAKYAEGLAAKMRYV